MDKRFDAAVAALAKALLVQQNGIACGSDFWPEHQISVDKAKKALIRAAITSASMQAEAPQAPAGPTDEQLRAAFELDSGGPNPFYRCKQCGQTEPGLTEYLAAHWRKHQASVLASMQVEAPQATKDAKDAARLVSVGDGYFAREDGAILDPDKKPLIPYRRNKGYLCVSLWDNGQRFDQYVHRLIATAFCTKRSPLQTQVNHRDGDRANNAASNLEWCSPGENSMHAARVLFKQATRPVIGTCLADGTEVEFPSLADAVEHGFIRANIVKVIEGLRNSHGGYTWRDAARKSQGEQERTPEQLARDLQTNQEIDAMVEKMKGQP